MDRFLSRLAIAMASLIAAAILVTAAIAFFGTALYLSLCDHMTPPLAALFTGGAALIVALLIALAARLASRRPAIDAGDIPPKDRDNLPFGLGGLPMELGDELGRQARAFVKQHSKGTLIVSLAGGFALGVSPRLRAALLDLLKR